MSQILEATGISKAETEYEAAAALRARCIRTEKGLRGVRTVLSVSKLFTALGSIFLLLEAIKRHWSPEDLPQSYTMMPKVLAAFGPSTKWTCAATAATGVGIHWLINRTQDELNPGRGERWTRPIAVALIAYTGVFLFGPLPFIPLFCIAPAFWLLNPKSAVVLSPTYLGAVETTPDITARIHNETTTAQWVINVLLAVGAILTAGLALYAIFAR